MDNFETKQLSGRNRRLLYEWHKMKERITEREDLTWSVTKHNTAGLPVGYQVDYHILSICGVENIDNLDMEGVCNPPVFASIFKMQIDIPEGYPCIDAMPTFHFLTEDKDRSLLPHPWHPNIRFFGDFAGRVCLNMADTYTDLAWGVERIALYLRYDLYHAIEEPPYPEDLKVARWVVRQGEPNGWIYFDQKL